MLELGSPLGPCSMSVTALPVPEQRRRLLQTTEPEAAGGQRVPGCASHL